MSTISGYDSSSMGMLLSSLNNSKSGSSNNMFSFNYSDYSSIKNGTYFKLMKSYYSNEETSPLIAKKSTSTSKDSTKTLASVENSTGALTESAKNLYKNKNLFEKKTTKNEDGKSVTDYDRDAIYKAVDEFVSDYNSVIKSTEKSNTSKIAKTSASMITGTQEYSLLLKKAGITIDSSDDTMKLDKDQLAKADISTLKSLFSGNSSFAYSTATKASMLNYYAKSETSKSNTYGSKGSYSNNYTNGDIYDSFT